MESEDKPHSLYQSNNSDRQASSQSVIGAVLPDMAPHCTLSTWLSVTVASQSCLIS